MKNSECQNVKARAAQDTEETKAKMSPKGALRLPPLLDARRLEYGIIDAAFKWRAVYDRVFVWQIRMHAEETFIPGGNIIQPEAWRDVELRECPMGIVVSAGLGALDSLRSNGMDLGHKVAIIAVQPWGLPIEPGSREQVLMLQAGDLVGSEDLELALRSGACRIVAKENEHGQRMHRFEDVEGKVWDPVMPWISDDT